MSTTIAPPSAAALKVFSVLCRNASHRADGDGEVNMSRAEIAQEADCTAKAISAMTKRLQENGMIRVERVTLPKPVGHVSNRYVIPRAQLMAELERLRALSTPNGSESNGHVADG